MERSHEAFVALATASYTVVLALVVGYFAGVVFWAPVHGGNNDSFFSLSAGPPALMPRKMGRREREGCDGQYKG